MKKLEIDDALKLNRYFIERDKELGLEYTGNEIRDSLNGLFAAGCYLHMIGQKVAGLKAVESALKSGLVHEKDPELYYGIKENLAGNEITLTLKCRCHKEILKLFSD